MTKPLVRAALLGSGACCAAIMFAQNPPVATSPSPRIVAPSLAMANLMTSEGDRDGTNGLSRTEVLNLADTWFEGWDVDGMGRVKQDDFVAKFQRMLAVAGDRPSGARAIATLTSVVGFFEGADQNDDALLERTELKETLAGWFGQWDVNGDSELVQVEIVSGLEGVLPRTNLSGVAGRTSQDSIPGLPTPPPSPVLSPKESMATIKLVEGFKLELAASEPMVEDPVALSFDEDGRAYVVEMRSYMTDIDRKDERAPISRISRLEDTDGDGRFDRSTVFVDGLILPRAVAATAGGILYVSDYTLYFAQDTDGDGRADRNEKLDADYGPGNVEHAPNGLFRAMDNWIYNGESPYRYRWIRGTLIKQVTEVRGQWGMTQDNFGRLHYNVNNSQLLGDFAPPNTMGRNPNYPSSAGLNLFIATDQTVFPIRMTTAINRGYSPEVLSPEGKAYVFASSCSPVVYRGDNYPPEFLGNAFVLDPALNLIKRNVVFDQGLTISSKFAYTDREFLASTDERFRPSNLYNGPDGTLWFVDLYRGITQHGQFMTEYLRRETLSRGLEQGIHLGRIYRIVSTAKKPKRAPRLSAEPASALVDRLASSNGWVRDTAQRLLVERGDRAVVPALIRMATNGSDRLSRLHALWTLEGLFVKAPETHGSNAQPSLAPIRLLIVEPSFQLPADDLPPDVLDACLQTIRDPDPKIQVTALRVTGALTAHDPVGQAKLLEALEQLGTAVSTETLFQVALNAGNLGKPRALTLLARVAAGGAEHRLIREGIMSGLATAELQFLQLLISDPLWAEQRPGRAALFESLARAIVREGDPVKVDVLLSVAAEQSSLHGWRQRSLLDGLTAALSPAATARKISFSAEPKALSALRQIQDPNLRRQVALLKTALTWPGHSAEEPGTKLAPARVLTNVETASIEAGKALYQQLCAGCHGLNGQGVVPMAPPLVNSEWVLGPEQRLMRIMLQGVTGTIHVNGVSYEPPNILPEMPGLVGLEDSQIASVLSYIRRAWDHAADPISSEQVGLTRQATVTQRTPWTEEQLLQIR